jgi:hypothetical protein
VEDKLNQDFGEHAEGMTLKDVIVLYLHTRNFIFVMFREDFEPKV